MGKYANDVEGGWGDRRVGRGATGSQRLRGSPWFPEPGHSVWTGLSCPLAWLITIVCIHTYLLLLHSFPLSSSPPSWEKWTPNISSLTSYKRTDRQTGTQTNTDWPTEAKCPRQSAVDSDIGKRSGQALVFGVSGTKGQVQVAREMVFRSV